MSSEDRRRQLVGLGLRALTERPIHEVSLDEIAVEAGISRSLLFHYFPTKTAFYEDVVAAAGRRVARTVRPDDDVVGRAAIDQFLARWMAQIARRRDLYLALVRGNLADLGGQEVAGSLREQMTAFVVAGMSADGGAGAAPRADVVHAWLAYVEDLALAWSGDLPVETTEFTASTSLIRHCHAALDALIALDFPERSESGSASPLLAVSDPR